MAWTREAELAWAAGFFDGEGSAGAVLDKRYRGRVAVNMCVVQAGTAEGPPDTLLRFQRIVGMGSIEKRGSNIGRLGKKPLWVWRLFRVEDVRTLSRVLAPYLGVAKIDQISRMMALRAEYEGLKADLESFCKRGHQLPDRVGVRKRRCRLCYNAKHSAWTRSQRLTVARITEGDFT